MKKHLLSLTILILFNAHTLDAHHNKTHPAEAAPIKAVENPTPTQVITTQPVAKVRHIVTQLEQQQEVKGWMTRNKKFLMSAGISATVIAAMILWWWFKKQNHGNLAATQAQQNFADPLRNKPSHVTSVTTINTTPVDPFKFLMEGYVENTKLFPNDNGKRTHTFSFHG